MAKPGTLRPLPADAGCSALAWRAQLSLPLANPDQRWVAERVGALLACPRQETPPFTTRRRRACPARMGRPAQGNRLANLSDMLANPATVWRRVIVPAKRRSRLRRAGMAAASAWLRAAPRRKPPVSPTLPFGVTAVCRPSQRQTRRVPRIRRVLIRDPLGRFAPQALLCTNPAQNPVQSLRWFVQRWQLEVTFHEERDHLGVETQRHREAIRPEGRKREGRRLIDKKRLP